MWNSYPIYGIYDFISFIFRYTTLAFKRANFLLKFLFSFMCSWQHSHLLEVLHGSCVVYTVDDGSVEGDSALAASELFDCEVVGTIVIDGEVVVDPVLALSATDSIVIVCTCPVSGSHFDVVVFFNGSCLVASRINY